MGPALFRVHTKPAGRPASPAGARVQYAWPLSVRAVPGLSALLTPRSRTFFPRRDSAADLEIAIIFGGEVTILAEA